MLQKLSNVQIFLILLGSAIVGIILGQILPPFRTWFAKSGPEETPDCKTADGKDGKKDASGNCVALPESGAGERIRNGSIGRENVCGGGSVAQLQCESLSSPEPGKKYSYQWGTGGSGPGCKCVLVDIKPVGEN